MGQAMMVVSPTAEECNAFQTLRRMSSPEASWAPLMQIEQRGSQGDPESGPLATYSGI